MKLKQTITAYVIVNTRCKGRVKMFRLITKLNIKNFDKPYILEDDFGTQRAITVKRFNELVGNGKVVTRNGMLTINNKDNTDINSEV